jgi:hypothetical protein
MSKIVSKKDKKMKKQNRTDIENKLVLYAGLSIILCVAGLIILMEVLSKSNVSYINELISSM